MGGQVLRTPSGRYPVKGGGFFYFDGLFMDKTARSSASFDGPQWAGPNTAIESFWCCTLVEI